MFGVWKASRHFRFIIQHTEVKSAYAWPSVASLTVPLSLTLCTGVEVPIDALSAFASSFFFAAAICHAGIAARPFAILPYGDDAAAGFSGAGVDAAATMLP